MLFLFSRSRGKTFFFKQLFAIPRHGKKHARRARSKHRRRGAYQIYVGSARRHLRLRLRRFGARKTGVNVLSHPGQGLRCRADLRTQRLQFSGKRSGRGKQLPFSLYPLRTALFVSYRGIQLFYPALQLHIALRKLGYVCMKRFKRVHLAGGKPRLGILFQQLRQRLLQRDYLVRIHVPLPFQFARLHEHGVVGISQNVCVNVLFVLQSGKARFRIARRPRPVLRHGQSVRFVVGISARGDERVIFGKHRPILPLQHAYVFVVIGSAGKIFFPRRFVTFSQTLRDERDKTFRHRKHKGVCLLIRGKIALFCRQRPARARRALLIVCRRIIREGQSAGRERGDIQRGKRLISVFDVLQIFRINQTLRGKHPAVRQNFRARRAGKIERQRVYVFSVIENERRQKPRQQRDRKGGAHYPYPPLFQHAPHRAPLDMRYFFFHLPSLALRGIYYTIPAPHAS